MIDWTSYFWGLIAIMTAGTVTWIVSVFKHNVSIVDSLWAIMFAIAASVYALHAPTLEARGALVLVLVSLWAARLSGYITWRNWGEPEDRRYRDIRKRNEPNFAIKSIYLVFGLQGVLAWIISLPLLVAIGHQGSLGWLDYLGIGLWCVGMIFEAGADAQLVRFKAREHNKRGVLDKGLWRYSRHPNYFGNFCIWWGFYLIALSAGGWWSIVSPLLMSFLLLKVSGVGLLEKDIKTRRPAYRDYIERTSAFFPWPPKQTTSDHPKESTVR
jgi:steroid 5-alpha reductase family enzyme